MSFRRMWPNLGMLDVGRNTAMSFQGSHASKTGWKSSEMMTGMQPCAMTSYNRTLLVCEEPRRTKQNRDSHNLSRYASSPRKDVETSKPGSLEYSSSTRRRAHEFGEPAKKQSTGRPSKRAVRSSGAKREGMEITVSCIRKLRAGNISLAIATGTVSSRQQPSSSSSGRVEPVPGWRKPLACIQCSLPVSDPTLQCSNHAALRGKSWRPKSMLKTVQKLRPLYRRCKGWPWAHRNSGTKYSTSAAAMADQWSISNWARNEK
mmetsp:Transcript_45220/g.144895  ORF Transcript_45220/g.144895 Transcript_45220/m.144895 type:complete len:261 (+) Transcript_45220:1319-2101(+)